ncbi:hypothetical protein D1AOALGA4SA_11557 [Olavius algarvensis Delta 1 endosymbiont]|nr:hypothetical protein D1AOALGA4SA_11557 [Olavius algarvensis Delta 1 endosymbiont]
MILSNYFLLKQEFIPLFLLNSKVFYLIRLDAFSWRPGSYETD